MHLLASRYYAFLYVSLVLVSATSGCKPRRQHAQVFAGSATGEVIAVPMTDPEGNDFKFKQLEGEGALKRASDGGWELSAGHELWFLGDSAGRGPYGMAIPRWLTALHESGGDRVPMLIGNHDYNKLNFLADLPDLEDLSDKEYVDWLKLQKDSGNHQANQLRWLAKKYGLEKTIVNAHIELAAESLGISREEATSRAKDEGGKISESKLEGMLAFEVVAKNYWEFISPGGDHFRYLEKLKFLIVKKFGGKKWLLTHSGDFSRSNLGVTPGAPRRAYESEGPMNQWPERWEASLEAWREKYFTEFEKDWRLYREGDKDAGKRLKDNPLPSYADANFADKHLIESDQSVVYPPKSTNGENLGVGDEFVRTKLAEGGVDATAGGHNPEGALPAALDASIGGRRILIFKGDTSFSQVEGQFSWRISSNGEIHIETVTPEGYRAVNHLGPGWEIGPLMGKGINGRIIVATNKDKPGEYLLLEKTGYTFRYLSVADYAIDPKKVELVEATWSERIEKERQRLVDAIKASTDGKGRQRQIVRGPDEKVSPGELGWAEVVGNRNVLWISGASGRSLREAVGQNPNLEAEFEAAMRAHLQTLSPKEWLILGGGTVPGLEGIVSRINAERSMPFEYIAVPSSIANSGELDDNINKYLVTEETPYFWDDFGQRMLDLLKRLPGQHLAVFASGGAIVRQQILDTVASGAKAIKVVLFGNLSGASAELAAAPDIRSRENVLIINSEKDVRPLLERSFPKAVLVSESAPAEAPSTAPRGGPVEIEADVSEVLRDVGRLGKPRVVMFVGYSDAGYEDMRAVLAEADRILDSYNPKNTCILIGATASGVGAFYERAKQRGFITLGIVSSLAKSKGVALSPFVDRVYYVEDATWGGLVPGTNKLSPTSEANITIATDIYGIGGGAVGRDELIAAEATGKLREFIPADMNHQIAVSKAKAKGTEIPTDFRGAAGQHFGVSVCRQVQTRTSAAVK